MNFDDIDLLVRRANPVPDPKTLEPPGSDDTVRHERRRAIMQVKELRDADEGTEVRRDRSRRGATVAAAAALLVVGLVAVTAWAGDDGDDPTAATSPAEVADSFMAAIAAGDAERAAEFTTDRALAGIGGLEGLRAEARWREANGFDVIPGPCMATVDNPSRTILRCSYAYNAIHSDELGFAPFEGSAYRVVVEDDGRISSFQDTMEYTDNGFSVEVFEPFVAWMEANHPDDLGAMLDDDEADRATDESIELWERRSREWVDSQR